jgi:hypothetical protein
MRQTGVAVEAAASSVSGRQGSLGRGLVAACLILSAFLPECRPGAAEPARPPEAVANPPAAALDAGLPEPPDPSDASAGGSGSCSRDEDCVAASCCHPSACVPRASAPDCKDVLCTMECRPETLDCGGRCLCQNGQCAAVLNDLGGRAPAN